MQLKFNFQGIEIHALENGINASLQSFEILFQAQSSLFCYRFKTNKTKNF